MKSTEFKIEDEVYKAGSGKVLAGGDLVELSRSIDKEQIESLTRLHSDFILSQKNIDGSFITDLTESLEKLQKLSNSQGVDSDFIYRCSTLNPFMEIIRSELQKINAVSEASAERSTEEKQR